MPTRPERKFDPDDKRVIACKKAMEAAGGFRALALALGITPQATNAWQIVPVERCPDVEEITGISVFELRPDFFRSPPERRSA